MVLACSRQREIDPPGEGGGVVRYFSQFTRGTRRVTKLNTLGGGIT